MTTNRALKTPGFDTTSSWSNFRMPEGGTAKDIRQSVAHLKNVVTQEQKVLLPPNSLATKHK